MFTFNDKVYIWVLDPVATGYSKVLPADIRGCISNFFYNLGEPVRSVNCLLQGRVRDSGLALGRFVINSIFGVFGLADPASNEFKIAPIYANLGETMSVWGIGDGFYLVVPLIGSSTVRDFTGTVVDGMAMATYSPWNDDALTVATAQGANTVNRTSLRLGEYEELKSMSFDPYIAFRNGYFQIRSKQRDHSRPITNKIPGPLPGAWCFMLRKKFCPLVHCYRCVHVHRGVFFPISGFATPDPTEQFRPFLEKVTETLADPQLKTIPKSEQSQRIIGVVRERFDFREMSRRVIGQQWRSLSEKEQGEFEALFTELLQYAYVGKIDEYSGQQVQFTQQRIRGERAEVQTLLVDKDRSIPVSYIMLLRGDQWMAYDVVVEGVSLIRNYMEQFSEILRKDGYPGLVKQIEEKIVELEKGIKKT
jgi:ABC-type transporter lipoprotein component MlaA/ABC-type transporter MlaC component